ncbi:hypothetical protein Mtc_1424 [Methanocella conradii HZ254]|uniref:Uncharacterized protein n=1 Tax=Methanocella conradii (strain DSM 24694 / JCM 17849 / CGMCC 1.5162 / HZ254) TaxID=1041930 RepID=H8I4J9_METCZ|nr:hypothetical protein [Methanocella conradii]AFD00178.1 hypothetical protein Mtc_1424 [Methanocella conradii HZ254]MDI6896000.1 hypothetical protein [Methanocella conradii]
MSEAKSVNHVIAGKLVGFTKRWNPFSTEVFARVEVDSRVLNVPIDYRQQKFIQMEHPINSQVSLIYKDGRWQIISRTLSVEQSSMGDGCTAFL